MATLLALAFGGCATVEKSPSRLWVREWNGLEPCHKDGHETPCSYEELIEEARAADWSRTRRALVGIIDKGAETTPVVDPVEWEVMYAIVLLPHLAKIQSYYEYVRIRDLLPAKQTEIESNLAQLRAEPACRKTQTRWGVSCISDENEYKTRILQIRELERRSKENLADQTRYSALVEKSKAELPHEKERVALYARRLLELPNRSAFTHYILSRVNELLYGTNYPSDISIPMGARSWSFEFTDAPKAGAHVLEDFRERYHDAAQSMRGGVLGETVRAGVPFLWGGLRFNNELLVNQMNSMVTLSIVDRNGKNPLIWLADVTPKNGNRAKRYPVLALSQAEALARVKKIMGEQAVIKKLWRGSDEIEPVEAAGSLGAIPNRSPASTQNLRNSNGGK